MLQKQTKPTVWCFTTYFAEGLPYAILRLMSSVFFTDIGLKERYIGYLNFLGIPWNLKFIWAPLVDIFGKKRTWMITMQALITLGVLAVAACCWFAPARGSAHGIITLISGIFVVLAFIAATNDVAIDGYYMEGLTDPKEQAAYTGFRVFAYRLAMILVRSGFIAVAAFAAIKITGAGQYKPWAIAFGVAALTMLVFTVFHIFSLPQFEQTRKKSKIKFGAVLSDIGRAFISYSQQPRFVLVIVFIIFYKIGDEVLFSMGTPFLMRELLVTKAQIYWLSGLVGAFAAIAGTSMGGIWIKMTGLKKAIWPLTIIMNFNIWAYIWLAHARPLATTAAGAFTIAIVHGYEQMAAGLGNAVLIVYILRTCKVQYKASHYAIGSAIMSLFSTLFGGFGGVIVERFGYLNLFLLAFALSIPSMLLLFWVPIKSEP
ncbi:MAG: hypothetical protein PHC61_09475 [Chitinivibrionales bacterium]|nr:hypothetical protein [Chitinivibrionales bacterium]